MILRIGLILIITLGINQGPLFAQKPRKVYGFDIDGLKLNQNLDQIIKKYNINNIRINKDVYGIINGYEIKKRIGRQKVVVVLNFTGEKRLYRIHYNKRYEKYRFHSKDLYKVLVKKYGAAWTDSLASEDQKNKNVYACWGTSCKKYPTTTPILTAKIFHSSGRLELMLADNRIFNKDWKLYKKKLSGQKMDRGKAISSEKGDNDAL